jgi:enterochelin esterase-like enzyme
MRSGGHFVIANLRTKLLPLPLDYRVYLPPCYSQQPERRYPVLYLFHGQGFTDDQWERLGAGDTADRLIASGKTSPFLIVMPRDRYGGQPSEDNFGQVVANELIPYIDNHYRTLAERDYRAVGGLSRGAGWSVHMALTYWQLFGALGAHSPAIFYEDAQHMRPLLDSISPMLMPRIYMDAGDKDRVEILDAALWFEDLLNARGIPHEWHLFSGYHEEAYWSAHVEQYLLWYAREW